MLAVTTFPENAPYADAFLWSYDKFWPVPIFVYYEGSSPAFESDKIVYRPLDHIEARTRFLNTEIPNRTNQVNGFLYDAKRFCHKAFAQIDALDIPWEGKVVWLDADVVTHKPVPEELLEELLEGAAVTHLGRDSYSETGFVGFNKTHPHFPEFLKKYRSMYEEAKILSLLFWTDCHALDHSIQGIKSKDLTNGKMFDHVFDRSPLGKYCTHLKGPKRKRDFLAWGGLEKLREIA